MPTTASGKGRILGMGDWTDDDLITDVERPTPPASAVVNDWFWFGAPAPTYIPWTWLSMPMALRLDQPINSASIINNATGTATTATNPTSQAAWTTFPASGSITSAILQDAANFAAFLVAYYNNPITRAPTWTIDLAGTQFASSPENRWRVLGRELGDRVTLAPSTIVDPNGNSVTLPVPAGLPPAARSLVIEGIQQSSSPTSRVVTWTTSPLLGSTPGVEGPWFRLDYSFLDGTDVVPF